MKNLTCFTVELVRDHVKVEAGGVSYIVCSAPFTNGNELTRVGRGSFGMAFDLFDELNGSAWVNSALAVNSTLTLIARKKDLASSAPFFFVELRDENQTSTIAPRGYEMLAGQKLSSAMGPYEQLVLEPDEEPVGPVSIVDTSAPTLVSLTFQTSLNVTTTNQSLLLSVVVNDSGGGGIRSARVIFNRVFASSFGTFDFLFMTTTSGQTTLSANPSILTFNTPGPVQVNFVDLIDTVGNLRRYTTSDLTALGIATSFSLNGATPDTIAPTLVGFAFSTEIDLTLGNQGLYMQVVASDSAGGAGLSQAVVTFDRTIVTDVGLVRQLLVSGWNATVGDQYSSILRPVLATNQSGPVTITRIDLRDRAGNVQTYTTAQLAALGFETVITLVGATPDTTPPSLANLTFAMNVNVTNMTAPSFTFNATAFDTNAIQQLTITFDRGVGWDTGFSTTVLISAWTGSTGLRQQTLSMGNVPGFVSISRVVVRDLSGNSRSYEASDLRDLGIATQFGLTNGDDKYLAGDKNNQSFIGGGGNDQFRGFAGYDVASVGSDFSQAFIEKQFDGSYRIRAGAKTDLFSNVERVAFDGQSVALGGAEIIERKFNDFTGDGKADIAFRSVYGGLALWTMNGTTITNIATMPGVDLGWRVAGEADFSGDGKADFLWRNNDGGVAVWLMDGLSMLAGSSGLGTISNDWMIQDIADYSGDGKSDILWRNNDGTTLVWIMDAATRTVFGSPAAVGWDWRVMGSGDTDGDGKSDIVLRNEITGAIYVWRMNGTTLAATGTGYVSGVGAEWEVSAIADLNGDGRDDIIWRNQTTGAVNGWLMDGTTIQEAGYIGTNGQGWAIQGAGDFNGDNKADLFWSTANGDTQVWQLSGLGVTSIVNGPSIGTGWLAI